MDTPLLAPLNSFRTKVMELNVVENCVHGFHVYQDIWTPATGEHLSCQMEDSNAFDPYVVAIRKGADVIGHVPCKISAACSLFCTERRYSHLYNYRFPPSVFCRFTTGWFADILQA